MASTNTLKNERQCIKSDNTIARYNNKGTKESVNFIKPKLTPIDTEKRRATGPMIKHRMFRQNKTTKEHSQQGISIQLDQKFNLHLLGSSQNPINKSGSIYIVDKISNFIPSMNKKKENWIKSNDPNPI